MGAREYVLAVDDDASVLETTRNMLDDLGYRPIAADNLDAALSTLSHQAIDVAIIDLAMPGVSGLNVGLELQRQQPCLPIVCCSGYPDLIEKTSKHMNGSLLLSKPCFSQSARTQSIPVRTIARASSSSLIAWRSERRAALLSPFAQATFSSSMC
ncbi:hypothetical protein XH92_34395 [Bradyrhizobium sp. CCBAU 53421]|nr:hypothetical protein XH92_34395 [Bradyrhizobium sp. CCBAU 53421]